MLSGLLISNPTNQHRSPVGASLLANALGQAMKMLNVPPPSRAGSLPQDWGLNEDRWFGP
jgi:hypothetical protein